MFVDSHLKNVKLPPHLQRKCVMDNSHLGQHHHELHDEIFKTKNGVRNKITGGKFHLDLFGKRHRAIIQGKMANLVAKGEIDPSRKIAKRYLPK
tara:strand:- start:34 stop:315 length:282 start_codon:yes stop_codon:yes gene_type:complete